jgi:PAS domain S-box-containing protein
MSQDIIKLLRKSPIFSSLDSASLKKISTYLKEKTCTEGQVLFKEGTLGDKLYIIKEGAIRINKEAKEGEEEASQVLRRVGEVFGEAGFLDEVPRPVTASADKPAKVLRLSRSNFLTILNQHPLIAYQIVKAISARLKQTDLRIIDDLKEKNEQLQKANLCLSEGIKDADGQDRSDLKKLAGGESPGVTESIESISDRLFSSIPFAIVLTDEEDVITLFNQAAEKEFDHASEDVIGKPVSILWDESSWQDASSEIQQQINEKSYWDGEIVAKKKDGERFICHASVSGISEPVEGNQSRLYLCRNSTEVKSQQRKEMMEELSSERLYAFGEIGGILEKDIDNLSDAFDALPYELDEANLNHSMKTLATMRNAINGIKGKIADLTSAHASFAPMEPIDLLSLFSEELLLLKSQDKFRDITFTTHFEKELPQIEGDRKGLRKLFYIIMENSALALKSISRRKKSITIEVGSINKKQQVQIQILDNGVGFNPSNLRKVFKERFTTWKDGLGLGLLSAARIIEHHGGSIEVESDQGSYTLMVIKFPVYQEKPGLTSEIESAIEIER